VLGLLRKDALVTEKNAVVWSAADLFKSLDLITIVVTGIRYSKEKKLQKRGGGGGKRKLVRVRSKEPH
jgi:hypothetical protein